MKKKLIALAMSAVLCISLAACGNTKTTGASISAETVSATTAAADEMFTDRDYETDYSDFVTITLSDGNTSAEGSGVTVDGNTVTITDEGTYLMTGTLTDGQIVVDAADTAKIQIVLDNVSVTSQGSAALYVKSADKVFLTMAEGSENALASSGEFVQTDDNTVDGAIFAKSDLTMNGNGILTIASETGHGVVTKDDLKITSGTYVVTAAAQGLAGKDSVRIAAGTVTITAGKDGIHAENSEDTTKGFVYIVDGTFTITAEGDGISASGTETILNGTYDLTTGGGSASAAAKIGNDMGGGMRGGWNNTDGTMPSGTPPTDSGTASTASTSDTAVEATPMADTTTTTTADTTSDDSTSTKGLKAGGDLVISGGTFIIDSADDAVHSNGNLTVSGGEFTISTGDDGFHADAATSVSSGTVNITESYEGIEGATIVISGGTISLVASDDGLNAAGGNDGSGSMGDDAFGSDSGYFIAISGGTITVDAGGDGIDSNGDLTVSGGTIYVSGPTNSGNGALDYNSNASITGGVIVAVGATGMDQNFGSDSTQGSILYQLASFQAAGTVVTLKDSGGNVLASYTPAKQFQSVVISAPGVASGSTYTLTVGSETETIEMTDTIYGTGSQMGGGMNGGPSGGMGGGPGGGHPSRGGQDATTSATMAPDTNQTATNG
ncbi:MAG: carbohydrate-binding domain-containing protein [Lawsonibacter sp.]